MATTQTNGVQDGERTRKREMPEWMYDWGAYPNVTNELGQARELLADWLHEHKYPSVVRLVELRKKTKKFLQEKR